MIIQLVRYMGVYMQTCMGSCILLDYFVRQLFLSKFWLKSDRGGLIDIFIQYDRHLNIRTISQPYTNKCWICNNMMIKGNKSILASRDATILKLIMESKVIKTEQEDVKRKHGDKY